MLIKRVTYKWDRHPEKTHKWFEKQQRLMTEEQIAQELDCSFSKSTKGRVYPQYDYNIHSVENLMQIKDTNRVIFFAQAWNNEELNIIMKHYNAKEINMLNVKKNMKTQEININ